MKNIRGTLMLLVTAMIWGVAFVAQSSAADHIGTFTFNASRSVIAAAFVGGLLLYRRFRGDSPLTYCTAPEKKRLIIAGIVCGIALFISSYFQQHGIGLYPPEAAASGRAGFLTATYVVIVGLCSPLFGKKFHFSLLLAAFGCIAGLYLLCLTEGISSVYLGDVFVFCCAFCFAAQIMAVDHYRDVDGLAMSCIQFITVTVLSAIGMLLTEEIIWSDLKAALIPILYAGIFSSGVAYTLQIIAQRFTEPAVASIVMSLESVFAALAGWVILGERLSPVEILGCCLVFAAVIFAQSADLKFQKEKSD